MISSRDWNPNEYLGVALEHSRVRGQIGMDVDSNANGTPFPRFRIAENTATGTIFAFLKESTTYADDNAFTIAFQHGNDATPDEQAWDAAQIVVTAVDITDGTEDGRFAIQVIQAGSQVEVFRADTQIQFNPGGADVDFKIEGDTDVSLFYVNAGTDRVGISTTVPGALLEVENGSTAGAAAVGVFAFLPVLETVGSVGPGIMRDSQSYPRLKVTAIAELLAETAQSPETPRSMGVKIRAFA